METLRRWALYLLILSIPFNGIPAPLQIGELSRDGFFYASLPYLALQVLAWLQRPRLDIFGPLLRSQGVYIVLIVLSLLINLPSILANSYGTRTGMERYALSVMVFAYYFLLAVALYAHARNSGVDRFLAWLTRAFTALATGLAALGVVEVISWSVTTIRPAWETMRRIVAADATIAIGRLSGVSLEPSFNAFALLSCIPWLLVFREKNSRSGRNKMLLVWIILALCLISGSRTALAGLAAMAVAYPLTSRWVRSFFGVGLSSILLVVGAFGLGILIPIFAYLQIGPNESVSNITRSYLMMGAIQGGWEQFWGQGFGQAGFFVVQVASSAVQYSWELLDFFAGERYGDLPPVFSWYARGFGEFGIVGYLLLCTSFAISLNALSRHSHKTTGLDRRLPTISMLIFAQFLGVAFSIESLRIPQYWLAWTLISIALIQRQQYSSKNAESSNETI